MKNPGNLTIFLFVLGIWCLSTVSAQGSAPRLVPSAETFPGLGGSEFPKSVSLSYQGKTTKLNAAGSGVRRQLMFKVYEAAAYTEVKPLAGNPFHALTSGDGIAHIRIKFLRDTTGQKVQSAVEEGIDRVVHVTGLEVEEQTNTLLGYLTAGVKEGEHLELTWIPGVGLFTEIGGKYHPMIPGDEFAQTVMLVWFGGDPVSDELKRDMVRFVSK